MAHALRCARAAGLSAAALTAPGAEGGQVAGTADHRISTCTASKGTHWGWKPAQHCSACARAEEGGRQGAGRGRSRARGAGRRGQVVPEAGRSIRRQRSRGSQKGVQPEIPDTGEREAAGEGNGVTVLTVARLVEDVGEDGSEEASGEEVPNGHPPLEKDSAGAAAVEIVLSVQDSGSESESEESLRADIARLEKEAAERLLAFQRNQPDKAGGEGGEQKRGEGAESRASGAADKEEELQEESQATELRSKEAAHEGEELREERQAEEGDKAEAGPSVDSSSAVQEAAQQSGVLEEGAPAAGAEQAGGAASGAQQRSTQLQELVKAHAADRMFFYPKTVVAGGEVEVFLNREVSTLVGKGAVELLGSFNDWQYQQLGLPLQPSQELGEPWWTCKLAVPAEAYKLDFVFHSGEVYENNAGQDFYIAVEGGLDAARFAAWVGQQKRAEQRRRLAEKEVAQQAEREARRQEEAERQEGRDREAAAAAAAAARSAVCASLAVAAPHVAGVFFTEPEPIQAGQPVRIVYNRSYRPLCFAGAVWLHAGHNGWKDGVSIVLQLQPDTTVEEEGDWYAVEVDVPSDALVLDWVLADAPPESAQYYDNNELRDFHAPVGGPNKLEAYLDALEQDAYATIRTERQRQEQEKAGRDSRRAALRKETAARTQAAFLAAQSHVLYTQPQPLQAGQQGAVFYNPQATVLAGRQEVWMRGGFNRWSHPGGHWGPLKMQPTTDGTHLKATVAVPEDAYIMDAVFSERGDGDGGLYDNKGGLDYHIPIEGSSQQAPPLHIVHIALEMAPIAKVGGLGDVVTSLSRAVDDAGHCVEVILPKYNNLDYSQVHFLEETESFQMGATNIRTWQGKVEGLLVRFIEPENGMFWVGTIYGRRDDGPRFEFFCHAALEYLKQTGQNPDIIHCHDWSSAPAAWQYWDMYHAAMPNPRIVFTIHNLEFGVAQIGRAMGAANKATTVSPTYAREVSNHGAIAPHINKFHGIRNGIDADIWDPLGDDFLPLPYSSTEVVAGKVAAKAELQRRVGLYADAERPMVGFITRLTAQKGIHLIKQAIWKSLERGAQVILLGSAPDPRVHNEFQALSGQLSARFAGSAVLWLGYDEPLSHLIYAGSDIVVVPSLFEPCGLTQMTAMRYGAVPVVRKTGGLVDTVFDLDHDKERAAQQGLQPNGYSFEGTDAGAVDYALNRALDHWYNDRQSWNRLAQRVMEQDWSWNRPALDYLELYYGARK